MTAGNIFLLFASFSYSFSVATEEKRGEKIFLKLTKSENAEE
jgi:hypothetical protein